MIQLPTDFSKQMIADLGDKEFRQFLSALQEDRITSIRINKGKVPNPSIEDAENIPWCSSGYYLKKRPLFTMDPLFHAGVYYAQEASSMFVEQAILQHIRRLSTQEPIMLDLCASPGGKSTHLASLLNGKGWLVCNETTKSRVGTLAENILKWGVHNVTVCNNQPKDFSKFAGLFDLILIDAPCSGEGMFRKDERAIDEWSVANVRLCSERQRKIVADVYPALKDGGLLIYSTCTYNEEEDEKNVGWIANELGAELLPIEIDSRWGISSKGLGYHFYPHKTKGEGFFLAVFQKTTSDGTFRMKPQKQTPHASKKIEAACNSFLKSSQPWKFICPNANDIVAVPQKWTDLVCLLQKELHTIHNALPIGMAKGDEIIPHHALALSTQRKDDAFEQIKCSWDEAIRYLKKENIPVPSSDKGYKIFCYEGMALGFGKNIGTRCNNLYPSDWRIRMDADESRYTFILSPSFSM